MQIEEFDAIVQADARPEVLTDWQRQRATAHEFCRRFAEGSDTQLLGDQVGMGKTYVAMAVMAHQVLRANGKKALLITPPSAVLRAKWEQEIRGFGAYVRQGGSSLRPLVVRDYWDLVANLHDHTDTDVLRIDEGKLRCILHSMWQWAVKKRWVTNRQYWWPALGDFDIDSEEALRFDSSYCMPAWEAFLEKQNAERNDFLRRMLQPKGSLWTNERTALWEIKGLFKSFAEQQDAYEPNVFILGMHSLRRPRRDSALTRRFAAFVLAELLSNKWEDTCKAVIKALKKRGSVLPLDLNVEMLKRLRRADLYNTRACVTAALREDASLRERWNGILRDLDHVASNAVTSFFSDLLDRVVALKLRKANIELAVVDEVHNWKSGANGSEQFRDHFADAIPHKLLMSATPFQLAEDEMARIFGFATKDDGPTAQVVNRIHGEQGLVARCLQANEAFVVALEALPAADASRLAEMDQKGGPAPGAWIEGVLASPDASPRLAAFCESARAYRGALDDLLRQQQLVMIRHTKDRSHRSFHAGADFSRSSAQARHGLYSVGGLWDERHEFINYLAMRLDQRLREAARASGDEAVRAHLVRGLTSSISAYKQSSKDVQSKAQQLGGSVLDYMRLFYEAVEHAGHPKVAATVHYAVANYTAGMKTLVFCERVDTVKEIAEAIRSRIEPAGELEVARNNREFLQTERHLFVDVQLHRSWCRGQGVALRGWDEPALVEEASRFVEACLQREQALVSPRRVLRLLDLWFLRRELRLHRQDSAALRILAQLADDLESAAEAGTSEAEAVLTMRSDRQEADLRQRVDAVVSSVVSAVRGDASNLWVDGGDDRFDRALWALLESEAVVIGKQAADARADACVTFYNLLLGLETGLRRVALRPDFLRRSAPDVAREQLPHALFRALREQRGNESLWQKIVRFLGALQRANGTLNPLDTTNTARRSLWRGVERRDDDVVATLTGGTDPESRVVLCAAFNAPLAPDILVCTAIGSEGIDLHRECGEVIHHDLPWNPAKLEQRIGRIDRVGRLGEGNKGLVRVGIPFLAQGYEQFQYERVLSRARLFEVLLGKPEFDLPVEEEDFEEPERGAVREIESDQEVAGRVLPVLPQVMADWLRVDLSLEAMHRRQATGS